METEAVRAVVGAIPSGRWMSYADVAAMAGGEPRQAIGVDEPVAARAGEEGDPDPRPARRARGAANADAHVSGARRARRARTDPRARTATRG